MKITVCGSMQFAEKQIEIARKLEEQGHTAYVTPFAAPMAGKSDEEKEQMKLHQKNNLDAIKEHWNLMREGEAILVLNLDKNGIRNYIGANTFLEMGFAHVLNQKIFVYNDLPEMNYPKTEMIAMKPIIINQDLTKIKL